MVSKWQTTVLLCKPSYHVWYLHLGHVHTTTTGRTPAEMMFGRMLKTRLDLIHPNDSSRVADHQFKQKWDHDRTSVPRAINVFDPVFVLNPGRGSNWLTGRVINRIGNSIFVVELSN